MKKIFMLNKNIVHLIDDIFWHMGFKTETQAEKVILIIHFLAFETIITLILIIRIIARCVKILDLQIKCGRTKGRLLPKNVDDLGDQFRPAMHSGWLSYIRKAYPGSDAPDAGPPEGTLVLPD